MKQKIFLFILLSLLFGLKGQSQEPCGLKQVMESMLAQNPNFQAQNSSNNSSSGTCTGPHQIPIVFHVLHNNGPENITDEQIFDAVEELNSQFAGEEGGFNTQISFYIAQVDPEGFCTNGINRIQTNTPGVSSLEFNNDVAMKNLSRWPASNYLNVWVVGYIGSGGVGGYSYLPPAPSTVDGVVILHSELGAAGSALTHEIGHYFNLYHVWGRDWLDPGQTSCQINCNHLDIENTGDMVPDTDPCGGPFINFPCTQRPSDCEQCPNFPQGQYFYPIENYMSYDLACHNRFTEGQAQRMCKAISQYRSSLPKPNTEGCQNSCNISISTNTTFDTPNIVGGNIYIKAGTTLTITSLVEFGQNKFIHIENGGKLVLQGSQAILNKCPEATYWGGINIENGGELEVRGAFIYNAYRAIKANSGSSMDIDNIVIVGLNYYTGTGIWIDGDVNIPLLKRVIINHVREGIFAWNGVNNFYHLDEGEIDNTIYAISISTNSCMINDYNIGNTAYGIGLHNGPGSIIIDNQIGASQFGIYANWSPSSYIGGNTVGWSAQRGNIGVSLFQSGGSAIINNPQIEAKNLGVRLWQSDALVSHNNIDIFNNNNQYGGGIQLDDSHGSQILENYIDANQSRFGVETNLSSSNRIANNRIFIAGDEGSFAISSLGSMSEQISDNIIIGDNRTRGVNALNSTSNDYQCNNTSNTGVGLTIWHNSEMQNIQGNEFNSSIDLAISSQIGLQDHHGNQFIGGTAIATDMSIIPSSQFFVNANDPFHPNLVPTLVQPSSGWFIDDLNFNPYTCSGTQGPTWIPFNGWDPNEICKYYNFIKSIKNQKPKQFLVKLIHLLKYAKKNPKFILPNCIKLDSTFLALCNDVTKIVDLTVKLESSGKFEIENSKLTDLQSQYYSEASISTKENLKNTIKSTIDASIPTFVLNKQKDSIRIDSIKNELLLINCQDSLIKKWKDIYLIYTKFLQKDSVAISDRPALLTLSQECSEIYGDAIHLARAMANTFTNTSFDIYDNCIQSTESREKSILAKGDISIFPNPSLGLINISLPKEFSGTLDIVDAAGKAIIQKKIVKGNLNQVDLTAYNGFYFFKFVDDLGYVSIHKVIVIK